MMSDREARKAQCIRLLMQQAQGGKTVQLARPRLHALCEQVTGDLDLIHATSGASALADALYELHQDELIAIDGLSLGVGARAVTNLVTDMKADIKVKLFPRLAELTA